MARPAETPRDLLFGLLALQVGLIDQDQLLAAFGTWSRSPGKSLDQILLDRGAIDLESRDLLSAMAEKQLRLHGGDTEKSLQALATSPATRARLAALGDTDLTASLAWVGSHTPTQDATATLSVGTTTSEGQRFRVLRPHAQGGLGAVFVALDGELNREVALKRILDHHADDATSRARFLLEAEITGGLEHPGIVPVYGLGHHTDGRPYYAMRFIRGDSLKEAITAFHADDSLKHNPGRKSLELRKLLRRFVDVCNAIDYAHGRGILHRDLKPGNVIVGKYGETLVVDWGLAKPLGHREVGSTADERTLIPSSSSGSAETLPGSAIGTPGYMSPEQAEGALERLSTRSDVYSLGATLYAILSGRAPFEGPDLGRLLRDVQRGHFAPPRQLDATIDLALEAVCLKAMALDPENRYPSARALADDIDRWAADEPVTAWREPRSRRIRRWTRRNRVAMTAAAVGLMIAAIGLGVVSAVQSQANADLRESNRQKEGINAALRESSRLKEEANKALKAANDRIEDRFELAREAIGAFTKSVEDESLLKNEKLKPVRDKLLRSAAGFYEKLEKLLQGQSDLKSRESLADTYHTLGHLIDKIGEKREAFEVHRKGLQLRRDLVELSPRNPAFQADLHHSLDDLGRLARTLGQEQAAFGFFREAVGIAERFSGWDRRARRDLSRSLDNLGSLQKTMGDRAAAMREYQLAIKITEKLVAEDPNSNMLQDDLGNVLNNLGLLLAEIGDKPGALRVLTRAVEIKEKVVARDSRVATYQADLARSQYNLGNLLSDLGDNLGALKASRRALELREKLAAENPAVPEYQIGLAASHDNLGNLLHAAGDNPGALQALRRAVGIRQTLATENPAVIEYQIGLSDSLDSLVVALTATDDHLGALVACRRALEIRERLAEDNPAVPEFQANLAESQHKIGDLIANDGDQAGALPYFRCATETLRRLGKANRLVADRRTRLSHFLDHVGRISLSTKDFPSAVEAFREAAAIHEGSSPFPANLYRVAWTRALLAEAASHPNSGMTAQAAAQEADTAMEALRQAIHAGFRDLNHIKADTDLHILRGRADFQILMLDLAFPDNPFAAN